ncbi:MAG: hypothetical protein B7Z55_19355 [Planctomycetales bacterium 12-60-4]|nr:MAG: hypothetical protein B7Z55_19355 [Planctomycetales bacterium 12-60-4]
MIPCSCGSNDCHVWKELLEVPEDRFHRVGMERLQVDAFIDSTKRLSWVLDVNRWARQCEFRSANVVIWKSPEAFAFSCWKRRKDIVSNLQRYCRYFQQLRATRLPVVTLSYDQLVAEPEAQLRQLGNLLGIEYFPGKERFWEHKHHLAFGNEGTRLTLKDIAPAIRQREPYPDEFLAHFRRLEISSHMPELNALQSWLDDHDVSRRQTMDWSAWESPWAAPWWYYRQVLPTRLRGWLQWYR